MGKNSQMSQTNTYRKTNEQLNKYVARQFIVGEEGVIRCRERDDSSPEEGNINGSTDVTDEHI